MDHGEKVANDHHKSVVFSQLWPTQGVTCPPLPSLGRLAATWWSTFRQQAIEGVWLRWGTLKGTTFIIGFPNYPKMYCYNGRKNHWNGWFMKTLIFYLIDLIENYRELERTLLASIFGHLKSSFLDDRPGPVVKIHVSLGMTRQQLLRSQGILFVPPRQNWNVTIIIFLKVEKNMIQFTSLNGWERYDPKRPNDWSNWSNTLERVKLYSRWPPTLRGMEKKWMKMNEHDIHWIQPDPYHIKYLKYSKITKIGSGKVGKEKPELLRHCVAAAQDARNGEDDEAGMQFPWATESLQTYSY